MVMSRTQKQGQIVLGIHIRHQVLHISFQMLDHTRSPSYPSVSAHRRPIVGWSVRDTMLSMCTAVSCVVVVVEDAARTRRCRVIAAVHRSPAAQVIDLTLLQQGIVLVAVTAGRGSHATAATRAEVFIVLLEVVSRVGGESGLGLGGEGRVGDSVGEGSGAAEVHHVSEGHPRSEGEEKAVRVSHMLV